VTGATSVAAGDTHSLAVKSDGTVWAWGDNASGQLGNGTTTQSLVPVQVSGLSGVVEVSAGTNFSLARKSDGTVWSWGRNTSGQLGDGTTTQRNSPVQVVGLSGATLIRAGDTHSLALVTGGGIWGWGSNSQGELGSTLPVVRTTPAIIYGLPAAATLGAGSQRSGLVDTNGGVRMWGNNISGRLGNTTRRFRVLPVGVTDTKQAVDLYAGGDHAFIQRVNGKWLGWGSNDYGQLGVGNTETNSVPSPVYDNAIFRNATLIAAGSRHTLMLTYGMVVAMGDNTSGQLGDGTTNSNLGVWLTSLGSDVKAVYAGGSHSFAIKSDGTVWAWGKNNRGQLGDGTTTTRLLPVQIPSLTGVTALAAGGEHSLALKSDGTVLAWGANTNGQLGDASTTDRLTPIAVSGFTGTVVQISAGSGHSLARTSANRVYAWGLNASGQIGNNSTTNRTTPYLLGVTSVTSIAAGGDHNIILISDGSIRTWGRNDYGQIGIGDQTDQRVAYAPYVLISASQVVKIAANATATYAMLADGTVAAWGSNVVYQLGYSSNAPVLLPLRLRTPVGFSDTNKNGIDDAWEGAHVKTIVTYTTNPDGAVPVYDENGDPVRDEGGYPLYSITEVFSVSALVDSDGDGLLDIEEYDRSSDPWSLDTDGDVVGDFADRNSADLLNADSLSLVVLGGDYQIAPAGTFNSEALDVAVWTLDGNTPLVARPSMFRVLNGGGKLSVSSTDLLTESLSTLTDVDGTTQAYFRQPSIADVGSYVRVQAGAETYDFFTRSLTPPPVVIPPGDDGTSPALAAGQVDTDGDGIPDEVEIAAGLNPNAAAEPLLRNQTLPHPRPGDASTPSALRFLILTPAQR
jgi:alpha-tubulin suppressor-like RCC1 family protein